jgi:hypothetical protein
MRPESALEREYERRAELAGRRWTISDDLAAKHPNPGPSPQSIQLATEWAHLGGG